MSDQTLTCGQIVLALRKLSRAELQKIRQRCQVLLQLAGGQTSEPAPDEDWLLLGIISELNRRGMYVPPKFRADRGGSFGSFQTKSDQVRRLLELAAPGMDLVERRALGQAAAAALADYLSGTRSEDDEDELRPPRREATFNNMMLHVNLTPNAVERAYPGYMAACMLRALIRRS